jgi:hypothetical protein
VIIWNLHTVHPRHSKPAVIQHDGLKAHLVMTGFGLGYPEWLYKDAAPKG